MSGWNPPPGPGGDPYGNPNPPGGYGGRPGYGPGPGAPSPPPYGQQPPPYGQQPPPYGGQQTPPPFGQPQPGFGGPPYGPPPRRRSHAGLIIGGAVGAVVVLLIIVVAVVAISGGTKHTISTPSTAGGLTRNVAAESTTQIRSAVSQQREALRRATDGAIGNVQSAVYGTQPDKRYLFIGGTGRLGDPDKFVDGFRTQARSSSSFGTVTATEVSSGGDGKAVCAEVRGSVAGSTFTTAVCAWATETSFGEIVPTPQGNSPAGLRHTASEVAEVMRQIRQDVED